jgi:hypothetical protein
MLGLGLKGCFFPYQLPLPLLSPHCLLSSSSANSASKSVSESPLSAALSSLDIPCTGRLMNPATYGCRKDEGEYAAERLLNGVRVGEEDLLEYLRLA